MAGQPQLEDRAEQPYVGIAGRVASEAEFRDAVDRGFPQLFGWLQENGVTPPRAALHSLPRGRSRG